MAGTYASGGAAYTLARVSNAIPVRPAVLVGALLGVTSGAIALGEAFVFAAPAGAGVRASLYMLLGALLVVDPWAAARRAAGVSLVRTQQLVGLGTLAVLGVSMIASLALGEESPNLLAGMGGAACGWAGAQLALLLDAWRNASGGSWPRWVALAPTLCASALFAAWPGLGGWQGPWPVGIGLGVGAAAVLGLVRLVQRHGRDVLAP